MGKKQQLPSVFCREKKNTNTKTFLAGWGCNIRGFSLLVGVVETKPREK